MAGIQQALCHADAHLSKSNEGDARHCVSLCYRADEPWGGAGTRVRGDQAVAPPSSVIKSLRFMCAPLGGDHTLPHGSCGVHYSKFGCRLAASGKLVRSTGPTTLVSCPLR